MMEVQPNLKLGVSMKRSCLRFLVLLVAMALALPGLADTLELRDGRVVQGKYAGGTQSNVRFIVNGEVRLYPVKDVLAITFTEPEPAPAAPSPVAPASPAKAPAKAAAPYSAQRSYAIPAGTRMIVRMIDGVDSETNKVGDGFRASLEEDLVVDDVVVVPRNSDVNGRLVEAKEAGRLAGRSELKLELTEIVVQGRTYPIVSGEYNVAGEGRGGDTAKKVGVGAAVGAVVGAIAGGGKGAAIGAGVGAGAGTAIQVFTKGEQVRVPSETRLEFTLEQAVTIRTSARPAPAR